jgi:DNA-binding transcriptional LysR family regulator
MRVPHEELGDFRLADVLSLFAVRRWGSITAAARELRVTPSQISKSVARLEQQLNLSLLSRGARGAILSDAGERAVHHLDEMVAHWRQARQVRGGSLRHLTIAAPSYMNMVFLPYIAASLPEVRIRDLQMPLPLIRALVSQNLFDLALALGKLSLPPSWSSVCVGNIRQGLFANPRLARQLAPFPVAPGALGAIPFISPIQSFDGQFIQRDDGCPIGWTGRRIGHEVTTLLLALELATCTEQLVFGPAIAARRYVESNALVEIPVAGWQVCEPLYLTCNGERVLQSDKRRIVAALRTALAEYVVSSTEPEGEQAFGPES